MLELLEVKIVDIVKKLWNETNSFKRNEMCLASDVGILAFKSNGLVYVISSNILPLPIIHKYKKKVMRLAQCCEAWAARNRTFVLAPVSGSGCRITSERLGGIRKYGEHLYP